MLFVFFKKTTDFFGAILLLLLFSPLIVVTALIIKLTSKGPVFAQVGKRVGMKGRLFSIYKFRSMIDNAHNLLKTDPKYKKALDEQQKGGNYKIQNDPRITKIGKFIRKYSIDEIPQLINVIKGEMSIVGPRPCYPDELKLQKIKHPKIAPLIKDSLTVRPGITGFWQVSGRSGVDYEKRMEMDAYYARKKSIILDLLILLKTPWAMVSGKGAV